MNSNKLRKQEFSERTIPELLYTQSFPTMEIEEVQVGIREVDDFDTTLVWSFPSGGGCHFRHDCKDEFGHSENLLQKKQTRATAVTFQWGKTKVSYGLNHPMAEY